MLKTLMTATAISALAVSGAFAQTTQPSPAPTTPPAAQTQPAPQATAPAAAGQFIAAQKSDQWLASKFNGTDVLGPNNEKVGDVNDVLFDKTGKVMALVVGVGGFLGIGQKDVALDMAAFQMVPASTSDANTGASTAAATDDPNNIKLKISMTKDQLKQAPTFEQYRAPARTTSAPATGNTGTRPATPPAR